MADDIYKTQIKQKIAQFSGEIQQFDTEHFQYRVYRKQFNGKITQLIQKVMKAEPERYWRVVELAEAVLIADKQPNTPVSKYHTNNIGNAMTRLVKKGVVERVVKKHKIIQWKWIQK